MPSVTTYQSIKNEQEIDMTDEIKKFLKTFEMKGKELQAFLAEWQSSIMLVQLKQYIYHPRMWQVYLYDNEARKYWEDVLTRIRNETWSKQALLEQFTAFRQKYGVKLTENAYHVLNALLKYNREKYEAVKPALPKKTSKTQFQRAKRDLLKRAVLFRTPYLNIKRLSLKVLYVFVELWEYNPEVLSKIDDISNLAATYTLNKFNTHFLFMFLVPSDLVLSFSREFYQLREYSSVKEIRFLKDDPERVEYWVQAYNFHAYDYKQRRWDKTTLLMPAELQNEKDKEMEPSLLHVPSPKHKVTGEREEKSILSRDILELLNLFLLYPNYPNKKFIEMTGWRPSRFKRVNEQIKKNQLMMHVFQPNIDAFQLSLRIAYVEAFEERWSEIKNMILAQPFTRVMPIMNIRTKTKASLIFVSSLDEVLIHLKNRFSVTYPDPEHRMFFADANYKPIRWSIPVHQYDDEIGWLMEPLFKDKN